MSNLRRYYSHGNIYFVTAVTYKRKPLLIKNVDLFWLAIKQAKKKVEFKVIAWVIIPDHFHIIIDPLDSNLSDILKRIKQSFSMNYRKRDGYSGRVWQYRFWDHMIRDQEDMNNHINYIHYNPVKHNFIQTPLEYKQSSFQEFVQDGYYQSDWGIKDIPEFEGEYGE